MRTDNVRVILWGFGAMGSGMARMLLKKKGVEIVGVCDMDPARANRSIFEVLGLDRGSRQDVIIRDDVSQVITEGAADVVLLATDSFVKGAYEKIIYCLKNKINVITTAEEMAYPRAQEAELSHKLDAIARENSVSVLGTGINPGLIMDLLVILLTGACEDVESIRASRINSLSPFGRAVMDEQGVGLSLEEFNSRMEDGSLAGHVGFHESINMITDALGFKLSKDIELEMAPIVTDNYRESEYARVEAGRVAGCNMKGYGYVDGELKIEMIHPQQIEPESAGIETGDYIEIKGNPNINMSINPEVPGGIGTIAMVVNMIPQIINARPGLRTMIDLPVPRAIMGDMRDLIED